MRTGIGLIFSGIVAACSGDRFTNATSDGGPASHPAGSSASGGTSSGSGAGTGARASGGGGASGSPGTGRSGGTSNTGGAAGAAGTIGVPPSPGGSGGGPPNAGGAGGTVASNGGAGGAMPSNGGTPGGSTGSPPDSGACPNPLCSDGSCSRLSWTFDSGQLDGITYLDQPLEVRAFGGNLALAVDVGQLNAIPGISFTLPICNSGSVDISTKTLSFRVYFDGGPASSIAFYVQTAVPDPQSGGFLDQIGVGTGAWTDYSSPLDKSQFSAAATTITIQAGSLGGAFTGTIWFDDFRID